MSLTIPKRDLGKNARELKLLVLVVDLKLVFELPSKGVFQAK